MAAKVNYRKSARLEWTDLSKLTSGRRLSARQAPFRGQFGGSRFSLLRTLTGKSGRGVDPHGASGGAREQGGAQTQRN